MLVTDKINDKLQKTYSDANKYIIKVGTDLKYEVAYDSIPCRFTYKETSEEIVEDKTYEELIKEEEERRKKEAEEEEKRRQEEELKRLEEEAEARKLDLYTCAQGRISLSKLNLEVWLSLNPYSFTKSNGTTGLYSVTSEKQKLLAMELITDNAIIQAGGTCVPSWNTTGGVCESWTIEDLTALAIAIHDYVKPKVSIQQHVEHDILECSTFEDIMAINVGVDIYD